TAPQPPASPTTSNRFRQYFHFSNNFCPITSARLLSSSFSITSNTASPALQPSGLPQCVPPSSPAPAASMISFLPITPLIGTPAAIDLEMVIKSGSTPKCSMAKYLPVRPNPVWISSATSSIPCFLQSSATP